MWNREMILGNIKKHAANIARIKTFQQIIKLTNVINMKNIAKSQYRKKIHNINVIKKNKLNTKKTLIQNLHKAKSAVRNVMMASQSAQYMQKMRNNNINRSIVELIMNNDLTKQVIQNSIPSGVAEEQEQEQEQEKEKEQEQEQEQEQEKPIKNPISFLKAISKKNKL